MINEEISRKIVNICVSTGNKSANEIIKALKLLMSEAKKNNMTLKNYLNTKISGNEKPLKDIVAKGQLENIDIEKGELKELKKLLNRYGVKFSVMRDKENKNYSVFFQSKDTAVMEKAFKKSVENFEKKEKRKESTLKKIKEFKEKSRAMFSDKNKVKNKQKEQSL